ncbi:mitochondrial fission ELM1 family protein [Candidatus Vondammii sp. HM_W22]|uniref:mitochondrial fission ELM1 family protein n=1 Tax=Candidatus Vondammii sp. HM_W22 TaxID=2687299 RepID=UPI001F13674A|nr:mitochondrial fission ELM1 family protein [Candidatus Vondammii sp. HM_W22]
MKQPPKDNACVVWRLIDGKPGHENQTLGLCRALDHLLPIERMDIPVRPKLTHLSDWLMRCFPDGVDLPVPDLILGAGHATHFALLAARRKYGGHSVVLMKPSLPLRLFDLCIAPQHDQPDANNVIVTRGVLNPIEASPLLPKEQVLFLIGGNSGHFDWNDNRVIRQVLSIAGTGTRNHFMLTNSRRTPTSFLPELRGRSQGNLEIIPWEQTDSGWVGSQLSRSHTVWVTEDSVSMIYEALTSGAVVGLLQLPGKRQGRVVCGIKSLVTDRQVTPFNVWQSDQEMAQQAAPFNEARRCADWIYNQWLK